MLTRFSGPTFHVCAITIVLLQICILYTSAQNATNATNTSTDNVTSAKTLTTISKTDSTTIATTDSTIIATTNSTVIATTDSTIIATTNSTVIATTDSTVIATTDSTIITITNNASISSSDSTTIHITDSTPVTTIDSSATVTTIDSSATIATTENTPTTKTTSGPNTATVRNVDTTTIDISSTTNTICSGDSTTTVKANCTTVVSDVSTDKYSSSSSTDQIRATTRSNERHKVPPSYLMPHENLEIPIPLQLKCAVFNDSLMHGMTIEDYFRTYLELAFNQTEGFMNITIVGFWEGNDGVNFIAFFKNVPPRQLLEDLDSDVYIKLSASEVSFDQTSLVMYMQDVFNAVKNICTGELNKCPKDFKCVPLEHLEPWCEHICSINENPTMCLHGGYCVVDTEYNAVCRCTEDGNFIFGGEKCELKAERLALDKEYIIAIAAGVGGGIILILIIAIIIICWRKGLKKRQPRDNILDNVSEQSYLSFKGSEDGTRQPDAGESSSAIAGIGSSMFRLSEERAENPRFNPYLSISNVQLPITNQMDISPRLTPANPRAGQRQSEWVRESLKSESRQFQDREPNYGEPAQLSPSTTENVEMNNKYAKTSMHQPMKVLRPLTEFQQENLQHSPMQAKVYDYSNPSDSATSHIAQPSHNNTNLYDFEYENRVQQERGVGDPYSIKRPLVSARPDF